MSLVLGVDCAAPLSAGTAKALYDAGYRFVGRYFAPDSCGAKVLKRDEAARIGAAGLRVLSVFEIGTGDFSGGAVSGQTYGEIAKACAVRVGMPEDGVIYFAIDTDTDKFDLVADYLRGAAKTCAPYRVGVYGSFRVVEAMKERDAAVAFWQCMAWSGKRISAHADVYQHTTSLSECGISVDRNICPDMDAAGLWLPEVETPTDAADNACPWLEPTANLRRGSSGDGVRWLQWQLNQNGAALTVDGSFGPATELALISYQKANGLTADGICGPATRAALLA